MATEISQRVSAAWRNWKSCSGVLCDRRMPVKLKGKVYKTVVRPALLYGAETWATTRGQEARLEVNEIRMLAMTTHHYAIKIGPNQLSLKQSVIKSV